MGNFLVRHASRVIIYYNRAVIRMATEAEPIKKFEHKFMLRSFRVLLLVEILEQPISMLKTSIA